MPMKESLTPESERTRKETAIQERSTAIGERTARLSQSFLENIDEASAARVLSIHEELLLLIGSAYSDNTTTANFISQLHEAVLGISRRLRIGDNYSVMQRQEAIANGNGALAEGIAEVIEDITGSRGNIDTRFVDETHLG